VSCHSVLKYCHMKSIQDQYKLMHLVLLECLVAERSSITCDGNLEKRIDEMRQSGALLQQFNRMHELRWQDQALRSASAQKSNSPVQESKSKNRSQEIFPGKKCHIYMARDMLYVGILKTDRLKFCIK
jgi:hypothetical protein